jgi:type I restriction enzyme S subunit
VSKWQVVKLADILEQIARQERVQRNESYRLMGVRWYAKGVFERERRYGGEISANYLYRIETGDLIYNRLFAWKGSFAVVDEASSGGYVSNEFPVFKLKASVDSEYIKFQLSREWLWHKIEQSSTGTTSTSRLRYKEADFLNLNCYLPPLPEQRKIAAILRSVDETLGRTEIIIAKLHAIKQQLIGRFLGLATYEEHQLNEVLTLVKRPVEVDPQAAYQEIGVRSHGKGIFHKSPVLGVDFGKKAVYYIEPGDFVLNIVFAWEGAVALASEAERGMVGSHRFPTFAINTEICQPNYLLYYFKTGQGKHQLGMVSPGGAGRNKTLSRSKFLRLNLPLPSLAEQTRIIKSLEAVEQRIEAEQAYLSRLERVKQGLMQKLLSGEIRVTP